MQIPKIDNIYARTSTNRTLLIATQSVGHCLHITLGRSHDEHQAGEGLLQEIPSVGPFHNHKTIIDFSTPNCDTDEFYN